MSSHRNSSRGWSPEGRLSKHALEQAFVPTDHGEEAGRQRAWIYDELYAGYGREPPRRRSGARSRVQEARTTGEATPGAGGTI